MAKKTAEEINSVINTLEIDDDTKIALMEDITDSVNNEVGVSQDTYDAVVVELDELKKKYIERFTTPVEKKEDEETEEAEEIERVDVEEI